MSREDDYWEWEDVLGQLDPDGDPALAEAAIDRALTLEIGLAARWHVNLDGALNGALAVLTGSPVPPRTRTSVLIDKARRILQHDPFPGSRANPAALETLAFAEQVNKERNRVLHDEWVATWSEEGAAIQQFRTDAATDVSVTHTTLRSIKQVSHNLMVAYYRVLGLLYFAKLGGRNLCNDDEIERELGKALNLMEGDFRG